MAAGSVWHTAATACAYGDSASVSARAQHVDRHPMLGQQPTTGHRVDGGGELEHHRKMVGRLILWRLHARPAWVRARTPNFDEQYTPSAAEPPADLVRGVVEVNVFLQLKQL